MNDAKANPQSRASSVFIALAFTFAGLLWLAVLLFFTADAIGDFREAHSPEFGIAPPWTWGDTFQRMGGVSGILTGFAPPSILLGYGLYLLVSASRQFIHPLTPSTR